MPIYEYRCKSCGHVFEELILRAADVTDLKCQSCGSTEVERVTSSFATNTSGPSKSTSIPSAPACSGS